MPPSAKTVCAVVLFALVAAFASAAEHGIRPEYMDTSANPGDDFYEYANGGWLKKAEIPPDRGSFSVVTGLDVLRNQRTNAIIEEAAKANGAPGTNNRKIADMYKSFMDEAAIERRGLEPVQARLKAIRAIRDKKELARAIGESVRADVDALNNTEFHTQNLFGLWAAPGFSDSSHYTAYLMQGGIVLPDREYYIADNEHMREVRARYQEHIATILKLAGFDDVQARAKRIFDLEHAIAGKHVSLADEQDVHKANNTWKQADFAVNAPGLDWNAFFQGAGLSKQSEFTVWQPTAFTGEAALVKSEPLETWKDWLAYHLLEEYSAYLPKAFAEERFALFGKTLSGTPQQRPREQRAINAVNLVLGDAVGQIYAQRYFSPEAKAQLETMVANIIEAFRKRIDALAWMAPATKAEAKAKLGTLYVGVGYPETWEDYSALEIRPDDLFGNMWRYDMFEYRRSLNKLGKTVNQREWSMTPQTVNAVNLPLQNAMNFPAAFLEPPFFDPQAPAAANYGAIGVVIGHEVSHTFDSEGAAFDSRGRLRNWWTPEDLKHFQESTQKLVEQYDRYKPFPDLALNGKQTLAENIADLGGLDAAHDAWKASLGGKPAPEQDGFSGDQQFFLAYVQTRAQKIRDNTLRQQVLTDSHSPSRYRALMVRNVDAWYQAFPIQTGTKLYLSPEERVRIW